MQLGSYIFLLPQARKSIDKDMRYQNMRLSQQFTGYHTCWGIRT
jgi:hypothetical protein